MEDLYIVVGAGGTGGYAIPEFIRFANNQKNNADMFIFDGDKVEGKNLLRQAFFESDLGEFKAQSLVNRYTPLARKGVRVRAVNDFIHTALDIDKLFYEMVVQMNAKYERVFIISCVDNNTARLRLLFATYYLQDKYGITVTFIDSGNNEWDGQTLVTSLMGNRVDSTAVSGLRKTKNLLSGISKWVADGVDGFKDVKFSKVNKTYNIYYCIFSQMVDWKNRLTRGDHELGCDEITVSNPQNIGVNIMASQSLILMLSRLYINDLNAMEFKFNAGTNSFSLGSEEKIEENYIERLEELVEYMSTEEGFNTIFKPSEYTLGSLGYQAEALEIYKQAKNKETSKVIKKAETVKTKIVNTVEKPAEKSVVTVTSKPKTFLESLKDNSKATTDNEWSEFDLDDLMSEFEPDENYERLLNLEEIED